jgi:aspartate dehydrogenase
MKRRIGIIGHGQIGSYVVKRISEDPDSHFEVAFVFDIDHKRTADLPENLVLKNLEDFETRKPQMICELAHPEVTRQYGEFVLSKVDYFLLSLTALADSELERKLTETARRSATRLFVPHGGVMGLDVLVDGRNIWEEVYVFMVKNPTNLDFSSSGIDPSTIESKTELYSGPTRGVCALFPRNVNTHATVALAGIGFDRTQSRLVADPTVKTAIMEIRAQGGGVDLLLKRSEEITGVSGASTPWSVLRSIYSTGVQAPGTHFC